MSISEMLHYYNVGQLIFQRRDKLKTGLQVLENKIEYMRKVAKQESVAAEVLGDIRKYELIKEEVEKCLKTKDEVESEMLCGMLKDCVSVSIDPSQDLLGTGKVNMLIKYEVRPPDFPHDYSII